MNNPPYVPQSIALEIKFIPCANTRGARVKVSCARLGANKSFSYDYSARGAHEQIEAALITAGILPTCILDMGKHYILVIDWPHREAVQNFLSRK